MSDEVRLRKSVIDAGRKAVKELVAIASKSILTDENIMSVDEGKSPLSDDRLKNAAATKKLCIFDAFDIIERINVEEERLRQMQTSGETDRDIDNFAESRAK